MKPFILRPNFVGLRGLTASGLPILLLMIFAAATHGEEASLESWPQFRGPTGQGLAAQTGLPLRWSDRKNVVWKTAITGQGWSSPVIDGDQIWLTTALDSGKS